MALRRGTRGWGWPAAAVTLAATLALSGCSWGEDEEPDEDAVPPTTAPYATAGPSYELRPAASVETLEIGQTYRGRLLTAHGTAPASGWFAATLRPRNNGLPGPDGFLEYDLVAAPPELNGGAAGAPARQPIRADLAIPADELVGAQGVRVYAGATAAAMRITVSAEQASARSGPRTQAVFTPVAPTRDIEADDPASAPPTPPRIGQ